MDLYFISISRHILVKYADRGLVIGGVISNLYYKLYMTAAITLQILFCSLIFLVHLRDSRTEVIFISVCLGHNPENFENSWRDFGVFTGILIIPVILLWFLHFSATNFVHKRSTNNIPPAIFGRYQRNVVTFSDTLIYYTIIIVSSIIWPLIFNQSAFTALMIYMFSIIVVIFVVSIAIPLRTRRNPMIFQSNQKAPKSEPIFYIHPPQLVPRRDHSVFEDPAEAFNPIIFVEPYQ